MLLLMAQLVNCTLKKCGPQSVQFGNKRCIFKRRLENLPISLLSPVRTFSFSKPVCDARLRHCWADILRILREQKPRIGCLRIGLGSGWLVLVGGGGQRVTCYYECGAAIGRPRSTTAPQQAPCGPHGLWCFLLFYSTSWRLREFKIRVLKHSKSCYQSYHRKPTTKGLEPSVF